MEIMDLYSVFASDWWERSVISGSLCKGNAVEPLLAQWFSKSVPQWAVPRALTLTRTLTPIPILVPTLA